MADDNDDLRVAMVDYFRERGAQVEGAEHGGRALELLRAAPADVLITDVKMPVMDGLRLLRELRRLPMPQPRVILCSGFYDLLDPAETASLDVDEVFTKPFYPQALEAAVRALWPGSGEGGHGPD